MKKLAILVLMLLTNTVSADVGLFFDDTARFAKTGIIQAEFPDVPLYKCRTFTGCDSKGISHARVGVFFSDFKKMEKEMRKRASVITDLKQVHTYRGNGFTLTVWDAVDIDGRGFLLVGIKTRAIGARANRDINRMVAGALVEEIYNAYQRAASVGGGVDQPLINDEVQDG